MAPLLVHAALGPEKAAALTTQAVQLLGLKSLGLCICGYAVGCMPCHVRCVQHLAIETTFAG